MQARTAFDIATDNPEILTMLNEFKDKTKEVSALGSGVKLRKDKRKVT